MVTDRKKNIFVDHNVVEQILMKLKDSIAACHFNLLAYCFMPDHLHILIEGKDQDSDMKSCVSKFKQKTGYVYKKYQKSRLWQKNYYEHVLRKNEDSKKVARYILENPIRKGLVKDVLDYPYVGCMEGNINTLLSEI